MQATSRLALGAILLSLSVAACEAQKPASKPAPKAAASQPAAAATSTTAAAPNLTEGRALYLRTCGTCHGPDGTGEMTRAMYPKIGDLTSPELQGRMKDEDIEQLVKYGRDKMPALGGVLKGDQLRSVIAYVRTLKKG